MFWHKKLKPGFSLLELLTVITIVGVLAALSVSYYRDYSRRVKILSATQLVGDLNDRVKMYYDRFGSMPANAAAVGVTTSPTPASPDDYATPPYLVSMSYTSPADLAYTCPSYTVLGYISNTDSTGAYSASSSLPYLYYVLVTFNTPSGWTSVCEWFEAKSDGTFNTSPVVPNCFNMADTLEASEVQGVLANYGGAC